MATTFPTNDAALVASYTKFNSILNGATNVTWINNGGIGLDSPMTFTGTSAAINVDVSSMVSAGYFNASYPGIVWVIDGGSVQVAGLYSSTTQLVLASGLANGPHTITVMSGSINGAGGESVNLWNETLCLKITGFVVDTGKTITAGTPRAGGTLLTYGDSITAGGSWPFQEWTYLIANHFDLNLGNCGTSGTYWEGNLAPNGFPGLTSSWNFLSSGKSRSFASPPTFVQINEGQNGALNPANALATLEGIRTACGTLTWIMLIVPFSQNDATQVKALYATYIAAHPLDTRIMLIDLGAPGAAVASNPAYSPDGVHYYAAGSAVLATMIIPYYTAALTGGTGRITVTSLNVTSLKIG